MLRLTRECKTPIRTEGDSVTVPLQIYSCICTQEISKIERGFLALFAATDSWMESVDSDANVLLIVLSKALDTFISYALSHYQSAHS